MYMDHKHLFLGGATGLAGTGILKSIMDRCPSLRIRASSYKHTEPFIMDKRVEYVYGDIRSEEDCQKLVRGCDCAIMAAALTGGIGMTSLHPPDYVTDNLLMGVNILRALHLEGVRRIVYIGSASLYQEFGGYIKEDDLDLNLDPHANFFGLGWVARYIEKLCRYWHENHGMDILIARPSNIFGPYAKFHPKDSNFIPALIRKAVDKMDPFEVWGSPDVTRDVIYSEDFADAIVEMLNCDSIKFDVFNIGSGVKTTVGDVVSSVLESAGHRPSSIKYLPDKPTSLRFRAMDCSKAAKAFGWRPRHTVQDGIEKTTRWWIENKVRWKK